MGGTGEALATGLAVVAIGPRLPTARQRLWYRGYVFSAVFRYVAAGNRPSALTVPYDGERRATRCLFATRSSRLWCG